MATTDCRYQRVIESETLIDSGTVCWLSTVHSAGGFVLCVSSVLRTGAQTIQKVYPYFNNLFDTVMDLWMSLQSMLLIHKLQKSFITETRYKTSCSFVQLILSRLNIHLIYCSFCFCVISYPLWCWKRHTELYERIKLNRNLIHSLCFKCSNTGFWLANRSLAVKMFLCVSVIVPYSHIIRTIKTL